MNLSGWEAVAVIYAAIVATAALALEVRRWVESGPRLVLTIMSQAKAFGGPVLDENTYLHARVTNRGAMPTTVTNFALHSYSSRVHRLWRKSNKAAVVNAIQGHQLPYVLQPGTEWAGSVVYNDELREWAETGALFIAIYYSHSSRPIQAKVKLSANGDDE